MLISTLSCSRPTDSSRSKLRSNFDSNFRRLGLNDEESQNDFLNKYLLSPGHPTLEWALPTPPPIHTFEELPLIKEHGAAHH